MDNDFDLESLAYVEQTFYDSGYKDGFAHGRIHGLIEGRALGREKGFEMWEELGFYEGFALTWKALLAKQHREADRASQHVRLLLDEISKLPRVNPSASDSSSDLDIPKLLRQVRSRYKVLCANLGVRPRLAPAESVGIAEPSETTGEDDPARHPRSNAIPIWKLDDRGNKELVTNQDLNY